MSRTTLDDAMATLTAGLSAGEHLSPDDLIAYQTGELTGDTEARIREHLAWCTECASTVLDLASWPEVELRDPKLERTGAEEAEDREALLRHLVDRGGREAATVPAPLPFQSPSTPASPVVQRPTWGPMHLLAAGLLLAVVGLSVQLVRLSQRLPLDEPQANVFVVDLEPAGAATVRTAQGAGATRVPAGMETVVLLLVEDDVQTFDDYAAELRGGEGEVFWQSGGLVRAPEGGFSVAVPLAVLPSDGVEIRLYGVDGGERELLATYRTRIERDVAD